MSYLVGGAAVASTVYSIGSGEGWWNRLIGFGGGYCPPEVIGQSFSPLRKCGKPATVKITRSLMVAIS